jgi:hypothetical protein
MSLCDLSLGSKYFLSKSKIFNLNWASEYTAATNSGDRSAKGDFAHSSTFSLDSALHAA